MTTANDPSGTTVHEIRWSDAFPWWLLLRAAGTAFSPTVILLAALGAVATWAGWSACNSFGLAGADGFVSSGAPIDGGLVLPGGGEVLQAPLAPSRVTTPWLHDWVRRLPRPLAEIVSLVSVPFRPTATVEQMLGALARGPRQVVYEMSRVVELFPILDERMTQLAGTLSGGQQQMLAIGRALLGSPRILLLDHAASGIDLDGVKRLAALLEKLQGKTTVLIATYKEPLIAACTRSLTLEKAGGTQ